MPEVLPDFDNVDAIGIDTETKDEALEKSGPAWPWKAGHIAGISLAFLKGTKIESHYLPIGHELGNNLDRKLVMRYMRKLARHQVPKIFFNSMYDMGWLSLDDVAFDDDIFDGQFGAALLDENRMSYSLDNVCKDWIGGGKDEILLKQAADVYGFKKKYKSSMWKLPPEYVGPYAEADAVKHLTLWQYEKPLLESEGLTGVMNLEMSLVPLLLEMRKRGVRVDYNKADVARGAMVRRKKELIDEIFRKFGSKVEVWVADSIAEAFRKQNLTFPLTGKTQKPSFTKEFLEGHEHELPRMIREARQMDKVVSTFFDGMVLGQSHNGRIHTELHPLKSDDGGTVGGRFSSTNPNLQQTYANHPEFGPMVRGMFLPEEGDLWGALDYSSQEPRLTIHFASLTKQKGAAEAVAKYHDNPRTSYHQMVADLCNIEYHPAKQINLGITYGMGGATLCRKLELPTVWKVRDNDNNVWVNEDTDRGEQLMMQGARAIELAGPEGQELLTNYHKNVPFVKGLIDQCANRAQDLGVIKTIAGRICRFDHWEPIGKWKRAIQGYDKATKEWGEKIRRAYTHKALNRLIQGSAADMTKVAMLNMWKEGIVPMLTMHDELDLSVNSEKQWRIGEEIMIEAIKIEVPVVVDCEFGATWGEAKQTWTNATS
tara:strand:+ start:16501 stop:18465 length:1965 start_codon:yes stop_codon:yes gene_type:complete